jgi:ADP-ribose pyrophosphatase YjhB (NUDIX family)
MKYCSQCGGLIGLQWIAEEGRARFVCANCGVRHYLNPTVIVCCMVHCGEEILMCRRAHDPGRGQWLTPCGYLESGETLEQGAARETFEETGVMIDPDALDLCSVVNMTEIQQVGIVFRVELATKPALRPGPECLEARFVGAGGIPEEQIAWRPSLGDGLPRFFEELRSRAFTIQLATLGRANGSGFRSRGYRITGASERPRSRRRTRNP